VEHSTRRKTSWRRPHYCSADTYHPDPSPAGEGVRRCHVSFREGHSACMGDPGAPPCGVRDFHALPDLLVCPPALRPGDPGPPHAITTAGTLQDERRNPHRTKDEIQDDSDARRLPTVYLLQYPTTVPCNLGEDDDFHAPLICPAPSCNYKRRRRVSFRLSGLDSSLLGLSGFSPQEDAQGLLRTHLHRLHF